MSLFDALEAFSARNSNVLIRAWLERVVCGAPVRTAGKQTVAAIVTSPSSIEQPPLSLEAEAGYSDFPLAPAKSLVILGSHTLYELVLSALVEAGLLPEFVHATDLLRFVYITDKVRLFSLCDIRQSYHRYLCREVLQIC
jgi:hypothetical protein